MPYVNIFTDDYTPGENITVIRRSVSYGSIIVMETGRRVAGATLELGVANLSGAEASLSMSQSQKDASSASLETMGKTGGASRASLETQERNTYPGSSSIVIAKANRDVTRASLEVVEGKGVDIMIDIIDAILHSGHGDC